MRILYVVSTLSQSGPTKQLYNLIKYLDRSQFESYMITLSPEPANSRWDDYESLGAQVQTLGLSRLKGLFLGKKALAKKISQIKPDIIHTQGIRADSLLAAIKPSIPWFITAHNYPFYDYPMKFGRIKGYLMAKKHLSVMHICNNVIACSKVTTKLLEDLGINAIPIQNGVDSPQGKQSNVKHIKEIPRPVFISVGSLIARKNMNFVIKAFNQYAKTGDGSLIILGDGPKMNELSKLASDRVHLLGKVSNVTGYLNDSDYFVSASLSEGLPFSVLEALASGLPVLLSDIPSHLEIEEECHGACKIYALSDNPSVLAEMMGRICTLFSQSAKEDTIRVVKEVFSSKAMSLKYQEAYLIALEQV